MGFAPSIVDDLMTKCGRHCCICRRFAPLHLQVHHIEEKAEGGTDDADNGIPICLTCHSDTHTDTKLTRRFTVEELKQHRELTFQLVREGKLRAPEHPRAFTEVLASTIAAVPRVSDVLPSLMPEAVEILLAAVRGPGDILYHSSFRGSSLQAGGKVIRGGLTGREDALFREALEQLLTTGFIEYFNPTAVLCRVTHRGYLAADLYIAAGDSKS